MSKLTNQSNSTQDTEAAWWMIERDDMEFRPCYFCWMIRPGAIPNSPLYKHGSHSWTPDWQRGEHFLTREEAEAHTNGDPLLHVREHSMMSSQAIAAMKDAHD